MGAPMLTVYLPPATTIGDRVGVRAQPNNPAGLSGVQVLPDGTDTINGSASFTVAQSFAEPYWGSCFTFVVSEVGDWWIESSYVAPYVE
jgi:hypothetical protein